MVVLPLVPVMPTSVSAALGSPARRAATCASSRRGSAQRTRTTSGASTAPSATTTHGATRDGFGHVPPAVGRLPGESEEDVAGADAARVGGRAAHLRVGASLHRDGAEPVEQRTQPHQGCALGRS